MRTVAEATVERQLRHLRETAGQRVLIGPQLQLPQPRRVHQERTPGQFQQQSGRRGVHALAVERADVRHGLQLSACECVEEAGFAHSGRPEQDAHRARFQDLPKSGQPGSGPCARGDALDAESDAVHLHQQVFEGFGLGEVRFGQDHDRCRT